MAAITAQQANEACRQARLDLERLMEQYGREGSRQILRLGAERVGRSQPPQTMLLSEQQCNDDEPAALYVMAMELRQVMRAGLDELVLFHLDAVERGLRWQLMEEEAQARILQLGGHPPGYSQNRDAKGRWAPGGDGAGSGGSQRVTVSYATERGRQLLEQKVGRGPLNEHQIAGLAGAEPGSHVTVERDGMLTNEGPGGAYRMKSAILARTAEDPKLRLMAWSYYAPGYEMSPYGQHLSAPVVNARAIRTQILAARQMGVDSIDVKCHAYKNDWVTAIRMGFDRPLDAHLWPELGGHRIPAGFHGNTIGDVVLGNGRASMRWWRGIRSSLSLYFDPRPGSVSVQRFNAYLRAHGMKEIP